MRIKINGLRQGIVILVRQLRRRNIIQRRCAFKLNGSKIKYYDYKYNVITDVARSDGDVSTYLCSIRIHWESLCKHKSLDES